MGIDLSDEFEDRFRRMVAEARRMEDRALRALKEFERVENCMVPLYELRPTADGYAITVDLPGVEKDEVNLLFKGDSIVVRAPCKSSTRAGRRGGQLQYFIELSLPRGIDEQSITASMKNGLLRIDMKKHKGGYEIKVE
jgi:HSP20 family molecular chaperone IbpA